ncbi:extracellular solute-binding protein [Amaricoccus solimangrovi]|uniref:ABC transporter substrate-binding protein n=1 Tax=Amaricoccus solimangrovi TaxID=2589815 RepID=A0A501WYX4_9RHOB|nr:extracellular solute-binding protein [Amaricoccus solimangrovi]TPE53535.1 ABC transporter substrate-binding protein [Amaricoccus solimangrovi]
MTCKHRATRMAVLALALLPMAAFATPRHGISMYGDPALPPDFVALPYANPEAPKGGTITFGEVGGFDSLNPYILKGRAPYVLQAHVFETLMARNWDEPFGLYGLLAESIDVPADRSSVEFTLRANARFSDGSPVTVDDVIWSMKTLAEKGLPRYSNSWDKVERIEKIGPRGVRFVFNAPDAELPLLIGLRPILKKADWDGVDFAESSLRVPVGSGAYTVGDFEPGRYIVLDRNPDYWGADLSYNRGLNNFDHIRVDYFVDGGVLFQAFAAGELSVYRELNPARWRSEYTFAAVRDGEVVKSEIPHGRPSGMEGFVFNTRRPIFADWRVRDALIHAFNYEFISQTVNGGPMPRRVSYFANSALGMGPGPAEGRARALLAPFAGELTPDALDAYALPVSDGSPRNRRNMRAAAEELRAAGWSVTDGVLTNAAGQPFRFEILLSTADSDVAAGLYRDALRQLGIDARITLVDQAQYNERRNDYDFDMIVNTWNMSLSPGNEQMLYWGRDGVTSPGTRNYPGIDSPATEAMIRDMLATRDPAEFTAAVQALDRVLTTGRYVIPFWFQDRSLIARKADLHYPDHLPVYGDWIGWLPEVWWQQ